MGAVNLIEIYGKKYCEHMIASVSKMSENFEAEQKKIMRRSLKRLDAERQRQNKIFESYEGSINGTQHPDLIENIKKVERFYKKENAKK